MRNPIVVSELLSLLPPRDEWSHGVPPERPVLALFAALPASDLCARVGTFALRHLEGLHGVPPRTLRAVESMLPSVIRVHELPLLDFEFPGGADLEEALQSLDRSQRLANNALKSLGDAWNAAVVAVAMVVENREWQDNPTKETKHEVDAAVRDPQAHQDHRRVLWAELLELVATQK